VLSGEDFRRTGRTLRRLAWDGLGHDGILSRLRADHRATDRAA
jgi:opine dehydrogenase